MAVRLSLVNSVIHWSRFAPDRTAISGGKERVSYRELELWSRHLGHGLANQCRTGEPVGVCIENAPAFWAAILGIKRAGCVPVVMHPSLDERGIESILQESQARTVVSDRSLNRDTIGQEIVVVRAEFFETNGANCAACFGQGAPMIPTGLSEVWGIIYTSGTTDRPKGVVRTNFSVLFELIAWSMELPFTRGERMYVGRPLAYVAGMMLSATALLVGGSVIAPEVHTSEVFLEACGEGGVDCAYLFPNQVQTLFDHCAAVEGRIRDCRKIITMGAMMDEALKVRVKREFGIDIIESWGNSEGLGTISEADDLHSRPGSVGRPFVSDNVVIVRDDFSPCEPFEVGRICEYTDTAMSGYQAENGLDTSMIHDGLAISEDFGYMDEAGYLFIKGRDTERVRIGEDYVFMGDIERVAREFKAVQDVKVVAIESPTQSPELVAVAELKPKHTQEAGEMLEKLNSRLQVSQRVKRIVFVNALPRNVGGKIIAAKVVKLYRSFMT